MTAMARRWTLIAILAAGCGQPSLEGDAEQRPWLREEAATRGLDFRHVSGHRGEYLMPEIMGGGCALADLDDDGDLDAYLVQSGGHLRATDPLEPNRLYRNDGRGHFSDVTEGSGAEDRRYGMGVACADTDGDGDTDLLVTNVGRNSLFENQGGARFVDRTESSSLGHEGWGTSAAFLDYDRDGNLDLYVVNYLDWTPAAELPCRNNQSLEDYCSPKIYKLPARDVLYRNLGSGRFADVSREAGISAEFGTGLGIGCADFDGDGHYDIFVANDGMADFLWGNRGDGTFENRAAAAGCAVDVNGVKKAGMGVTIADIDGDLDPDLLVCNLNRESDSLFYNEGGVFRDRTSSRGLAATSKPFTRFGMGWVDFDHDGTFDLYQANGRVQEQPERHSDDPYAEPNLLLRGTPQGFVEVQPRGGTASPQVATSRAAAFGDVDGDGAIDVLVVNRDGPAHLLLNRVSGRGNSLLLEIQNRQGSAALGVTVEIRIGQRILRQDVRAAYSYLASNDPRVHVGLGDASQVDSVRVRWIDGSEESFGPLAAGKAHALRQGEGIPP